MLLLGSTPRLEAHLAVDVQLLDLTKRIEADPANASLYLKRGEQHRVRGEWGPALADFERAAGLEPKRAAVHFYRGRALIEAGRPAPAIAALDQLLKLEPAHVEGRVTRAGALVALNRPLEAARELDRAIALQKAAPPRPEHYLERARAYRAAGPRYLERAVRGLDEGLTRLGPVPSLVLEAIDLEVRRRRFDAALGRVDRALAGAARRDSWLVRRGEILEAAGRPVEARQAYLEARSAIERLPPARRNVPATRQLETHIEARLRSLPAQTARFPDPGHPAMNPAR